MTTNTKPDLIKTLQGLSDRAYCDYITKMRSDACLGWEAKVQTQRFGKAEIEAHTKAGELLGRHKAFSEAAAKAALAAAAQPPADGALNTIAAMFHSAEEIEGPDGLAMMVDMSVWNDALDAFDEISGDEMEPAHPTAGIWVPTELAERVQETMGEFLMDHGWRQQDMDTSDEFGALLAVATKAEPLQQPERVPMTDKEIADVYFVALGSQHLLERDRGTVTRFARAVEEHHGIKPKEQSND